MKNLDEAVETFRRLDEAKIKPGDYVTAKDGRKGYVLAVNGDMVSFTHTMYDTAQNVTLPSGVLTVNPGKRMTEGRKCPPGYKWVFGRLLPCRKGARR